MEQALENAKQGDLPHDVRLVATVARLLDLHNSKRERGSRSTNVAQQPQVSAAAGYYLWLGLQTIQLLHRQAKQGSSGPVSVARIHEALSEKIGEVVRSDLEYCLAFCRWNARFDILIRAFFRRKKVVSRRRRRSFFDSTSASDKSASATPDGS